MTILSGLFIYPIKSCRGIALQQAELTPFGLAYDRQWMLVDAHGRFLTQRELPKMAQIVTQLGAILQVTAPHMPALSIGLTEGANPCSVTVWQDTLPAIEVSQTANAWFSQFLGIPVKLVRFAPEVERHSSAKWLTGLVGVKALNQFSDGFPILVANQSSLNDLNQRLAAKGVPSMEMARFRPNIVLHDLPAFEEDYLDQLTVEAEQATESTEITLKLVKPCPRCPIPTHHPLSGEISTQWPREPIETLGRFHTSAIVDNAITFGMNAVIFTGVGATLRVGQSVQTQLNF